MNTDFKRPIILVLLWLTLGGRRGLLVGREATTVMRTRNILRMALALFLITAFALPAHADGPNVGFSISVQSEGWFFLNPKIKQIFVSNVQEGSLAKGAGMVAGDEILEIEGKAVAGMRFKHFAEVMDFNAGETRVLRLKHPDGKEFDARLTKPKG
jgi:hypothetical protein